MGKCTAVATEVGNMTNRCRKLSMVQLSPLFSEFPKGWQENTGRRIHHLLQVSIFHASREAQRAILAGTRIAQMQIVLRTSVLCHYVRQGDPISSFNPTSNDISIATVRERSLGSDLRNSYISLCYNVVA